MKGQLAVGVKHTMFIRVVSCKWMPGEESAMRDP